MAFVATLLDMPGPSVGRALHPDFAAILAGFDLDCLDEDASSIVGLWPDLRIGYYNAGWARFAHANGGSAVLSRWPIGASIASALSTEAHHLLNTTLASAQPGGPPMEHEYECSSPTRWRRFVMRLHSLSGGYLITHSLLREQSHHDGLATELEVLYRDEHGLIVQCSHCRRTRRCAASPSWDWVHDHVRSSPPRTSHGLCPACYGYYFPARHAR